MHRCRSCKAVHPNNTLFCDQCGARLPVLGYQNSTSELGSENQPSETPVPAAERPLTPVEVVLIVSGTEIVLPLPLQERLTLGRADPERGHLPTVDLGPHRAYDMGISRQHAVLYQIGDQLYLEDLSSRNGTYVNGQRLAPFHPEQVDHGDQIRLGTLSFHILLK